MKFTVNAEDPALIDAEVKDTGIGISEKQLQKLKMLLRKRNESDPTSRTE